MVKANEFQSWTDLFFFIKHRLETEKQGKSN